MKLSLLQAPDQLAIARHVEELLVLLQIHGERTGRDFSIVFVGGSVFVDGELLRASRCIYGGALELGTIFHKVGASELGIRRGVEASDFEAFIAAIADALRRPLPPKVERPALHIRLRGLAEGALRRDALPSEDVDPFDQTARLYASAVVLMRRFFEGLSRGQSGLPRCIKRLAQRLVDSSMAEAPAYLGMATVSGPAFDPARRSVNSAILSLAMLRRITDDAVALADVAMAALLFDAGRARLLTRIGGVGNSLDSTQSAPDDVPVATATAMIGLSRIDDASMERTVIAFEAQWEWHRTELGPVYRGLRAPSLAARVVMIAHAFSDLLASPETNGSVDLALADLQRRASEAAERLVLRLLVAALGVYTTGTVVRLSSGEVGVVVRVSSNPALFSRPCVCVLVDSRGGTLEPPFELDLSTLPNESDGIRVVEVLATADDSRGTYLRGVANAGSSRRPAPAIMPPSTETTSEVVSRSSSYPPPALGAERVRTVPRMSAVPASGATDVPSTRDIARTLRSITASEHDSPEVALRMTPEDERTKVETPGAVRPQSGPLVKESVVSGRDTHDEPRALAPTAEGTLRKTPFVHLLVYALDQHLSGTMVFEEPTQARHAIYFYDGVPAKVRTATTKEPIDRATVQEGLLEPDISLGASRVQVMRRVVRLGDLPPDTRYAYYRNHNLLVSYGGSELTPCSPMATVMEVIRSMNDEEIVSATLAKLVGRTLALHVDADVRHFGFNRTEMAIVDQLRSRKLTLAEVVGAGAADERVARLTIYALAITRHFDLGTTTKRPVGFGRPAVEPIRDQAPSLADSTPPPSHAAPSTVAVSAHSGRGPSTLPSPDVEKAHVILGKARTPPVSPVFGPHTPTTKLRKVAQPETPVPPSTRFVVDAPKLEPSGPTAPAEGLLDPHLRRETTRLPRASATPSAPPAHGEPPGSNPTPDKTTQAKFPMGHEAMGASLSANARRAEILSFAKSIDKEDYFGTLGVAQDATPDQVKSAYFGLAKRFHPDRLSTELADLKPEVARMFARISEAYQTLSDVEKRKAYAALIATGRHVEPEQEKLAKVVDAAVEFQKAEILLKKNNLAGAEEFAAAAAAADPDQPEYLALLVWIRALRRGDGPELREAATSSRFDDLIAMLDDIVKREPHFERALFYRGTLLKRSGWMNRAISDFRRVAELNPKNIDAVREVRLYEMRHRDQGGPRSSQPPPNSGGSLFSKFFRK